jgi:hypothetical protein
LKLGQLSPALVDNDSPPYWRALDEDDLRTIAEQPRPSVAEEGESCADLVARQASYELENDLGVSALEEDAVRLLVGNLRQWKQCVCKSSDEDFVITREQHESRAEFAARSDEYDRQFSAAFDTQATLGTVSQMPTELDTLHKILAWAFQSRARAAIYLNNKIVADGGQARTFSADKSKMEGMIGCAAGIKRALQAGEWAQGDFEYQQRRKRILDLAQQPDTEEEAQAQAEEEHDVPAQLQAATKEQVQAHHNLQARPSFGESGHRSQCSPRHWGNKYRKPGEKSPVPGLGRKPGEARGSPGRPIPRARARYPG